MLHGHTLFFLIFASLFAFLHKLAVTFSLYWYYWWFDVLMHFWGGVLVTLGLYSVSTFSRINIRPKLSTILISLLVVTLSWEVFEWWAKLWQSEAYALDTVYDIAVGFVGGLLAHVILRKQQ